MESSSFFHAFSLSLSLSHFCLNKLNTTSKCWWRLPCMFAGRPPSCYDKKWCLRTLFSFLEWLYLSVSPPEIGWDEPSCMVTHIVLAGTLTLHTPQGLGKHVHMHVRTQKKFVLGFFFFLCTRYEIKQEKNLIFTHTAFYSCIMHYNVRTLAINVKLL